MNALEFLLNTPALFIVAIALLGLIVGSFLNVVVYRLPKMLEASWRRECEDFLGLAHSDMARPDFNLVTPGSSCPHCGHSIRAHENVPVLSYLLLGGRCSQCKTAISARYPAIEILTTVVSAMVAWKFGPGWQTMLALILSWSLIGLAAIDIEHLLLPDAITQPLLWLGLCSSLFGIYTDSFSSIIGAVAGYLSLWLIYHLFKLLTGKEGMGYGDFKLLAVLGAWLGWPMLLPIVLLSSLVGALVGILMILFLRHDRSIPIPFGPYLAAAGWIGLLWGPEIIATYSNYAGLGG